MVYEVYKGLAESEFEKLLEGIIRDLDGYIRWDSEAGEDENQLITNNGSGFHSAYFEIDQVGPLVNPLGELFAGLQLTLFTLGSASWYYALKEGAEVIDRFNVYWNQTYDEPEMQRQYAGNAKLFADRWGLPVEQIQDYIVGWSHEEGDERWGRFRDPEKTHARPGDRSPYGHALQCTDFLQALEVPLAYEDEPGARRHAFAFPGMVIARWRERKKGWFERLRDRFRFTATGGHHYECCTAFRLLSSSSKVSRGNLLRGRRASG